MKIEIKTTSEAFGEHKSPEWRAEVARILLTVVDHLKDLSHNKPLYDKYGSKVGTYES